MTRARSFTARRATTAAVLFGLAAQTACYDDAPDQTIDIATMDLSLSVTARARPDGTDVELWFAPPESAGVLRFSAGDRLFLQGDGFELPPSRDARGVFLATLPADISTWAVVLDRVEEESGAVDLAMFPPAALSAPAVASRDQPLEITWTPSHIRGASVLLALRGPCFSPIERALSDDVSAYMIQPADFAISSETCTAELTLDRSLRSSVPSPLLANVHLDLYRTDRITLESTP